MTGRAAYNGAGTRFRRAQGAERGHVGGGTRMNGRAMLLPLTVAAHLTATPATAALATAAPVTAIPAKAIPATVIPATALRVSALQPLPRSAYVNDRLMQSRLADLLRRECPTPDARMGRALCKARALKRQAPDQGDSQARVGAFLDDREQRKRTNAEADRYMRANGVVNGQPEPFCRLGRDEIARQTIAGSLLSAR